MIKAILACDIKGGIGRAGTLPWPHNKKDLAHFKKMTHGCTVVMGRGTWESEGMPKPLPGRHNVVVTSDPDYVAEGADVINDNVVEYLTNLSKSNTVFVIGGGVLVNQLLDHIQIFYLTRITGDYDCDTFIDLDAMTTQFVRIASVETDKMTTFETHFARNLLRDIYISTSI